MSRFPLSPLVAALFACAALAPVCAAARAVPDSLFEVDRRLGLGRPADPDLLALARRVVARREADRRADAAAALQRLGLLHLRRVEYALADSVFARALAQRLAAPRPDPHALGEAIGWRAESQRSVKRLAAAESLATNALGILGSLERRDTVAEARVRATLGNTLAERGEPGRAAAELRTAIALAGATSRPDSTQLGRLEAFLGRALNVADDARGSRAAYERAAAIQERVLGPSSPELAQTFFMATFVCADEGDYVVQQRFARRALEIRERVFGPDHPLVALALMAVGNAVRNLGDPVESVRHYERAVDILRHAPQRNVSDLVLALNNLATSRLATGDGRGALALYEEAQRTREQAFGPNAGRSFWSGTMIARALLMSGDVAAADSAMTRTFASSVRRTDTDVAEALMTRGAIAYERGERDSALAAFERAHALRRAIFGDDAIVTLDALVLRAVLRSRTGRPDDAWADARSVARASRDVLRSAARALSEQEALGLEREGTSGRDVMAELAATATTLSPARRADMLDAVIRGRLLVLDELADLGRSAAPAGSPLAGLQRELDDARDALAQALVSALRQGRAPDSLVAAARARRDAAERALAERSAHFRAGLGRADAGLGAIAAALPPGSALVSYLCFTPPGVLLGSGFESHAPGPDSARYLALVLRAGSAVPALVRLGAAAAIDRPIQRWVEACASPPPADRALARAAERRCRALGAAVRAVMWDPLARELSGAARVFVVPDGSLHAGNFLALPDARGGYLAQDGPTIHRLTAERDLLQWSDPGRAAAGLLAIGGADFDRPGLDAAPLLASAEPAAAARRSHVADSVRVRFAPLPDAAAEVREVAALWRASRPEEEALERLGPEASEAAFKRLAPGRRALHVATHGFALGAESLAPVLPAAATGATLRAVGAVVPTGGGRAPSRGPALLPGLAFAGANAATPAGGDDGFLTAEEITSLDLSGVEWAVLSACETGLADPGAVEAVQGLHRAFRRAGLHTAIVSLWAVDDEGTRAWMSRLYAARLRDGRDTAESVREACRGTIRDRLARGLDAHPFHWAAFVASGDWR